MAHGRPNAAYLTGAVYREGLPILLVIHNDDGDWQFLDGGPISDDDVPAVLHIHHLFDDHEDLRSLADLPEGWAAERDSVEGDWRRYRWEEPD